MSTSSASLFPRTVSKRRGTLHPVAFSAPSPLSPPPTPPHPSSRSPPRCRSLQPVAFSPPRRCPPPPPRLLRLLAVFSTPASCFPCRCRTHSLAFSPSSSSRRWCSNVQSSHLRAFRQVGVGFSIPSCWWVSCRFRSCPHGLGWLSSFAGVLHVVIVSPSLVFRVVVHCRHGVFCLVTAPHCSLSCCPVSCPLCRDRIALVVASVVE